MLMLSVFVGRFETQEDTGKHLQELQNRAEKEIRDLGAVKEKLEAEWELVKFMGQEENTELREKLEVLEEDITDQQVPHINSRNIFYAQNISVSRITTSSEFRILKIFSSLSKIFALSDP